MHVILYHYIKLHNFFQQESYKLNEILYNTNKQDT